MDEPLIDIIVDGEVFASRSWKIIPRAGEILRLKQGEIWVKVVQVCWGDKVWSGAERQWIQIFCESTEPLRITGKLMNLTQQDH